MKIVLNSEKLEEYLHASTNEASFLQPKNSSSFRVSNMEKLSGEKMLYTLSHLKILIHLTNIRPRSY